MNYNFPRVKFVDEYTITNQYSYVLLEINEVNDARTQDEFFEEMADAWHAMETFWRIVTEEKGEAFVQNIINKVIDKNEKRGYYERSK